MKQLKKKIVGSVTAGLLAIIAVPTIADADSSPHIGVAINDETQTYDEPAVVHDGRTLVPMRGIFESLGASVTWDSANHQVAGEKDGREIVLPVGQNSAVINGETVKLDVGSQIINGRTMVPLRVVGDALGVNVNYVPEASLVEIESDTYHGSPMDPRDRVADLVAEEIDQPDHYFEVEELYPEIFYLVEVRVNTDYGLAPVVDRAIVGRSYEHQPLKIRHWLFDDDLTQQEFYDYVDRLRQGIFG
ncbi:copper amine oxidase N-terminal domain-containing protein [Salsuginibacillus kocurii]|uniref:copper amine oxidase N-terminal domain-containing protein n=1 Tax=Salsuginibacillus kocurii TaxID=427078 RepID=UPI00037A3C9C|nr:copper amine oxidase N-terminal domain-containing protein [Salsuginibacillus kocurii]